MTGHIVFDNVTFHWPGAAATANCDTGTKARSGTGAGAGFSQVSFVLHKGDFALLTGPSGQGKSTLLRLLVRFEEPQQGRIFYAGQDLSLCAPPLLRRQVALVQQSPIMGAGQVRDVLLLPFTLKGNTDLARPSETQLHEALAAVRLESVRLDEGAESLSLGQKQRLALARTLLLRPDVLLLDEPTSALDSESRQAVEAQVEAAHAAGATVIMITHTDYRPASSQRPVRQLLLREGKLTEVGEESHV